SPRETYILRSKMVDLPLGGEAPLTQEEVTTQPRAKRSPEAPPDILPFVQLQQLMQALFGVDALQFMESDLKSVMAHVGITFASDEGASLRMAATFDVNLVPPHILLALADKLAYAVAYTTQTQFKHALPAGESLSAWHGPPIIASIEALDILEWMTLNGQLRLVNKTAHTRSRYLIGYTDRNS